MTLGSGRPSRLTGVIEVTVQLTMTAWLVLEAGLLIRDRIRGKGGAERDRGTLWLDIVIVTVAVVAAGADRAVNAGPSKFGSSGPSVAGLPSCGLAWRSGSGHRRCLAARSGRPSR